MHRTQLAAKTALGARACAGVLLLLGAFTFWVMDHGAQEANFNERIEPKKTLKPLATAPTRPKGGGMVEVQAEAPDDATPSAPLGNSTPLEPAATLPPPSAAARALPNNGTRVDPTTVNGTQS